MFVRGADSISHDGVEYTADEETGLIDLPADAARWVERVHGLQVESDVTPVEPEDPEPLLSEADVEDLKRLRAEEAARIAEAEQAAAEAAKTSGKK